MAEYSSVHEFLYTHWKVESTFACFAPSMWDTRQAYALLPFEEKKNLKKPSPKHKTVEDSKY